jgi:uncharacterized membrane protein YqgA involved in biofilm formation
MKEVIKEFIRDYWSKVDLMKTLVGLTILFVFASLVLKLIHEEIPERNREIIIHIIGMVEGALGVLVTFYYGSSKGSQKKDELIANSLPKDDSK